jgi:lipopolysaccharide assembly outer membrane protein LptD (OstA)
VGTRYEDECTTFDVSYVTSFRDTSQGTLARTNQGVLFRLELRTLGGVGFRQSLDAVYGGVADGIKN